MKKNLGFIVMSFFLLSILLYSCSKAPQTKEEYMVEYSNFIKDIQQAKNKLTEEEWQKQDELFQQYNSTLYQQFESDLGLLEKGKVMKNALQYNTIRTKEQLGGIGPNELSNAIKELSKTIKSNDLKNAIKDIKSAWNDDVKEDINATIDDLKSVWNDDLKEEIGASLSEIKDVFKDVNMDIKIDEKIDELDQILKDKNIKKEAKEIIVELRTMLEKAEKELDR